MDVAVYYLGGDRAAPRLYREIHRAPHSLGVVRAAVNAMLGDAPVDPDHSSQWQASAVLGVNITGTTIAVDLPAAAAAGRLPTSLARQSVQQLVYTATEAAGRPEDRVELRIQGRPATQLWGWTVPAQPLARDAAAPAPVWLTVPTEGATMPRTFTASGEAAVFEATVSWDVHAVTGSFRKAGHAMTGQAAPARGRWTQQLTLPPGRYVFRAYQASPKDGTPTWVDSATFTVR
jgi:hypothetical protein